MKNRIISAFSILIAIFVVLGISSGCNNKDNPKSSSSGTSSKVTINSGASSTVSGSTGSSAISGDSSNKSSSSTSSITTPKKITDPLKVNLKGATITIYTTNKDTFSPDSSINKATAAQAAMLSSLQSKLNCKIKVVVKTIDQLSSTTFLNIASGKHFADIIQTPIFSTTGYFTSDWVYDLSKVPTIDLSQNYLNAGNGVNAFHLGKSYLAVANSYDLSTGGNCIYFNKRILKEMGYTENYIYNLITQKKWNLSAFRSLANKAVKDLDGKSGITTNDRLGIIQIDIGTSAFSNVLQTMGASMIKSDSSGKFTYNMTDPSITSALSTAYNIFVKDGSCKAVGDSDAEKLFMSGHCLFLGGGGVYTSKNLSNMDEAFGVAPFPSADNSSTYSVPTNWNYGAFMIPNNLNSTQLSNAGAFLQALEYMEQDVIETSFKEYQDRYFWDDQSKNSLYLINKAQTITTASILGTTSYWAVHEGTYKVLYGVANGKSAETLIGQAKSAAIASLNELYASLK